MANLLYIAPFWTILIGGSLAAFRWGGWPERTVGLLYGVAALASLAAVGVAGHFRRMELFLVAIDLALTVALVVVALRADRWWPMCATSLVTIGAISHLGQLLTPGWAPHAYQFMEQVSSYPALLVWCAGIIRERSRRRHATSILPGSWAIGRTRGRSLPG